MQHKTSSNLFLKYGSVYDEPLDTDKNDMISSYFTVDAKRNISQLHRFDRDVYIEMQSGMATLLISDSPSSESLEDFAIHRQVKINAGLYFTIVSVAGTSSYKLITDTDYHNTPATLSPPFCYNRILPRINIHQILGYYYNIRSAGYSFSGEKHDYFELTYIDCGNMRTTVDGQEFLLSENDLIIYGPGQFHTQSIPSGESCSYVTILFDMETFIIDENSPRYEVILNKVFGYDKKIHTLIKDFVNESSSQIPYMNSLMLCLLQETIIRLLQHEFVGPSAQEKPVTEARQHYQDELLERILQYIGDNLHDPLTIAEICHKFSMSRSSLQILFKENLNQTPKKYISELKLERSCQLLREGRYTVSEIAFMLGFNSIHYFSRAFTKKYNMAPSDYSKQLFKN